MFSCAAWQSACVYCLEVTIYQHFNITLCKLFLLFSYDHLLSKLNHPLTYCNTMNIWFIVTIYAILNVHHIKIQDSMFSGWRFILSGYLPDQFDIWLTMKPLYIVNKSNSKSENVLLYEIQNVSITNTRKTNYHTNMTTPCAYVKTRWIYIEHNPWAFIKNPKVYIEHSPWAFMKDPKVYIEHSPWAFIKDPKVYIEHSPWAFIKKPYIYIKHSPWAFIKNPKVYTEQSPWAFIKNSKMYIEHSGPWAF